MIIKLPKQLYKEILADLERPHPYAYERVGFLFLRKSQSDNVIVLQGVKYKEVHDDHYSVSKTVGALINANAIRVAMQTAMTDSLSAFHVHKHAHRGHPRFSTTDLVSLAELIPSFFGVDAGPHGAIVFSDDKAAAIVWEDRAAQPVMPNRLMTVGFPTKNLGR